MTRNEWASELHAELEGKCASIVLFDDSVGVDTALSVTASLAGKEATLDFDITEIDAAAAAARVIAALNPTV